MAANYPAFVENLRRYLTDWGQYPYRCRVRTPLGEITPMLYSGHDLRTLNEIFCRGDYATDFQPVTVVDIGANIGISALYYLTRNIDTFVYCYEPNTVNTNRLRRNLSEYTGRYSLEEVAIWTEDGEVPFVTEPTGRYGHVGVAREAAPVPCRNINSVLEDIVAEAGRISVLKIDTEGSEEALVSSIRPDLLAAIDTLFYESVRPLPLHEDLFRHHRQCDVNQLTVIR